MTYPSKEDYERDAEMVESARRSGYDKCVVIGCPVMLAGSRDGFCSWHRRERLEQREKAS